MYRKVKGILGIPYETAWRGWGPRDDDPPPFIDGGLFEHPYDGEIIKFINSNDH